jgi:hypothetical protein
MIGLPMVGEARPTSMRLAAARWKDDRPGARATNDAPTSLDLNA